MRVEVPSLQSWMAHMEKLVIVNERERDPAEQSWREGQARDTG